MQKLFILSLLLQLATLQAQTITQVLYNANIITMDKANPLASAIAIVEDKIVAVGEDAQVLAMIDQETPAIDMNGKTILPGFVCAHNHLFNDVGTSEAEILASQQLMFENGITTFGNMYSDDHVISQLRDMDEQGLIKIKSNIYLPAVNNCGDLLGDWYQAYKPTRAPGEKVRISGVKIFTDGGTCGTLAAISWKYAHTGTTGDLFFDQQTLNNIVRDIDARGYQIAVHAQGDVATRQAVEALATVLPDGNPKRHRIEHNSYIAADVLPLYSKYGIIPVVWGTYPTCHIDALANAFGLDSLHWLEDYRVLIDANPKLPIAWHSDAPNLPLSPTLNLYSYVTKKMTAEDGSVCQPPNWLLEHGISVDEALAFMTTGAAYALHRDQEVGSLEPGKFADLVFLSDDPHTVAPADIIQIQTLATMADGEFVYCSDGNQWICDDTQVSNRNINSLTDQLALKISPNPFSLQTNISFDLTKTGFVEIKLYDILGRLVLTPFEGILSQGHHEINWQISHAKDAVAHGAYYCILTNDSGHRSARRIVITKT